MFLKKQKSVHHCPSMVKTNKLSLYT